MLDPQSKKKLIKKFRTHENDTGSSQIQIAILTEEIKLLTEHLQQHKKDFSSRRGLIKKVNERRKLLNYLHQTEYDNYAELAKKLKLKIMPPKIVEGAQPPSKEEEEKEKKSKGKK